MRSDVVAAVPLKCCNGSLSSKLFKENAPRRLYEMSTDQIHAWEHLKHWHRCDEPFGNLDGGRFNCNSHKQIKASHYYNSTSILSE